MTDFSIAVISPACRVLTMFWRPADTVWLVAEFVRRLVTMVWLVAEFIRWFGIIVWLVAGIVW